MSKVWLITGASRGIGAEIVKAALNAGDKVIATSRNAGAVAAALSDSAKILSVTADVTVPKEVAGAVKAGLEHFGRIDVLVNNAGYALFGAAEECSADELEMAFRTNVLGLAEVTRAVLPTFRAQRSGHVFNLSSTAGLQGFPGASAYCASKFAVEGYSESLAAELNPLGIHVTIVEPGYVRTGFLSSNSAAYAEKVIADYDATAGAVRRSVQAMDGHQTSDPKKLAQAILVLADATEPPLRFTAGADAVERLEHSLILKRRDLDRWRELSLSLAHD
jgi:NAD(P)-dependent dehydrogenase (short-subunit alcohol dehydrogenase family)